MRAEEVPPAGDCKHPGEGKERKGQQLNSPDEPQNAMLSASAVPLMSLGRAAVVMAGRRGICRPCNRVTIDGMVRRMSGTFRQAQSKGYQPIRELFDGVRCCPSITNHTSETYRYQASSLGTRRESLLTTAALALPSSRDGASRLSLFFPAGVSSGSWWLSGTASRWFQPFPLLLLANDSHTDHSKPARPTDLVPGSAYPHSLCLRLRPRRVPSNVSGPPAPSSPQLVAGAADTSLSFG